MNLGELYAAMQQQQWVEFCFESELKENAAFGKGKGALAIILVVSQSFEDSRTSE